MILLTVGNTLPFDRLVEIVDNGVQAGLIGDELFAQIGNGRYKPAAFSYTRFLSRSEFQEKLASSSAVISHAGIGTIASALKNNVPLLVFPRSPAHGELVDDHQEKTARVFESMGQLLVFRNEFELASQLKELPSFVRKPRQPNIAGVSAAISAFLNETAGTSTQCDAGHSPNRSN